MPLIVQAIDPTLWDISQLPTTLSECKGKTIFNDKRIDRFYPLDLR